MFQIRIGLENNLDVSIYAKSEFNDEQMFEIRLDLTNKYIKENNLKQNTPQLIDELA